MTIEVIRDDPPVVGRCRAEDCRREIEWVRTPKGQRMPVDHPLQVASEETLLDGTVVTRVHTDHVHWATCPAAASFHRKRR
jgi:hypothetical protein